MEKTEQMMLWGIVLIIVVCEGCAQSCLKRYQVDNQRHLLMAAIGLYIVICNLLVLSYQYKGLGIVNLVWSCSSIILMFVIGSFVYSEPITRFDVAGIALVMLGMFLIFIKDHYV